MRYVGGRATHSTHCIPPVKREAQDTQQQPLPRWDICHQTCRLLTAKQVQAGTTTTMPLRVRHLMPSSPCRHKRQAEGTLCVCGLHTHAACPHMTRMKSPHIRSFESHIPTKLLPVVDISVLQTQVHRVACSAPLHQLCLIRAPHTLRVRAMQRAALLLLLCRCLTHI